MAKVICFWLFERNFGVKQNSNEEKALLK